MSHDPLSRRDVLAGAIAVGLADTAFAQDLPPTPACQESGAPTIAQTRGRSSSRARRSAPTCVEAGAGAPGGACRPRADPRRAGRSAARWSISGTPTTRATTTTRASATAATSSPMPRDATASVPSGRRSIRAARGTITCKVQAPNRPVLTTQLYFPNEMPNRRDGLFRPELLMQVAEAGDGMTGALRLRARHAVSGVAADARGIAEWQHRSGEHASRSRKPRRPFPSRGISSIAMRARWPGGCRARARSRRSCA